MVQTRSSKNYDDVYGKPTERGEEIFLKPLSDPKTVLLQPFAPVETFLEDERHVTQCEQDGHFDQRADGRC
jgi:hypothetical protein